MILDIRTYGDPVLRKRGEKITEVNDSIRKLVADMIETMDQMESVAGLAAQQVGHNLPLFILNVLQWEERPSQMWKDGKLAPFDHLMPLVVINAEIKPEGKVVSDGEGCFSFPGIFGAVSRPELVHLRAQGLDGEIIEFDAAGLLSRAIQHEYDHTQGVLFIDHMDPKTLEELEPLLTSLNPAHRFL